MKKLRVSDLGQARLLSLKLTTPNLAFANFESTMHLHIFTTTAESDIIPYGTDGSSTHSGGNHHE